MYARIEFLDLNNRLVDLMDGAMLSTQFFIRQNESWIVQQSEVERLKIYLGELEDEIRIKVTPISTDGSDEKDGESKIMRVLANNLLKAPIIDVSRGLQGEDAIIPLLQENGGVIKVSVAIIILKIVWN